MGSGAHGASLAIDTGEGLAHNTSLDMQQNSPGMKSLKSPGLRGAIPEETGEEGEKSALKSNLMSGQGLKSHDNFEEEESQLESEKSPGLKSLMKSGKKGQLSPEQVREGLKESIKQNQKKVTGTTSIKNLIRSAATRH